MTSKSDVVSRGFSGIRYELSFGHPFRGYANPVTYGPEPYCRSHLRNSFELSPSFHSRHPETAYKLIAIRWNSAAVCMNLARFRLFQQKSAQLLMRCAVYLELCAHQHAHQPASLLV